MKVAEQVSSTMFTQINIDWLGAIIYRHKLPVRFQFADRVEELGFIPEQIQRSIDDKVVIVGQLIGPGDLNDHVSFVRENQQDWSISYL